jgi:5S rRNA maturation endonuclease (ribonuclease M5)
MIQHLDFEIINSLVNEACDDSARLMHELGISVSKQGKKWAGVCPVHDGDNPSAFNFYDNGDSVRGIWICRTHQCHLKYKKTLLGLIQGVKKCKWNQALDWLVKFTGKKSIKDVKIPDYELTRKRKSNRILHKLNLIPNQKTAGWSRDWVRKHLEIPSNYYINRGYSRQILDRYDIGYYKPQNRVSVPMYDDNYNFCVGFSARSLYKECKNCKLYHDPKDNCPEYSINNRKWKNSKDFNTGNYLYNYWFAKEHILKNGIAILVEGPGDVWRLEENGIHISLALFGVELTDQQRVILDRSGALSLIVLLDNDEAGKNASKLIYSKLNKSYRMYFPKISKDDVGELHSDEITRDIKPYIDKLCNY